MKKITDKSANTEGKTSDDDDDDDDGPTIDLLPRDGEDTVTEGKNPENGAKAVCGHSFLVVVFMPSGKLCVLSCDSFHRLF